jgi:hypothetical protein
VEKWSVNGKYVSFFFGCKSIKNQYGKYVSIVIDLPFDVESLDVHSFLLVLKMILAIVLGMNVGMQLD